MLHSEESPATTSLYQGLQAYQDTQAWLGRKERLLWGLKDPQEFQACLGHLALGDLVFLDHRDPLGHQDLRPFWVQLCPFPAHLALQDSQDSPDPETWSQRSVTWVTCYRKLTWS